MIKRFLRWGFLGLSLLFILQIFWRHSPAITQITWQPFGLFLLFIAFLITLLAFFWSGFIFYIILKQLKLNISLMPILSLYLNTNIYKYIPGNIGHFYLRISRLHQAGLSLNMVSLAVILEPILMAIAAIWVSLVSWGIGLKRDFIIIEICGSILILFILRPKYLNQILSLAEKVKKSKQVKYEIKEYPLWPLLGEVLFILLRGGGFMVTAGAFGLSNFGELMRAFSVAWLCGLVIPGAPGGLGVFEGVLIGLLPQTDVASLLGLVGVFRIISIAAEIIGALKGVRFRFP